MKQPDDKLNELLKRAAVPDRSPGYWEAFPKRVGQRLTGHPEAEEGTSSQRVWAWAGGLMAAAVVVVVAGLAISSRTPTGSTAQYVKLYREMSALFPQQVRSITCDDKGVHLDIADTAEVPVSAPLLVKVCSKSQSCREIITFSGQQVRVNGDTCEVLTDGEGNVLLVGRSFVWSSDKARAFGDGSHNIEAQRL